MAGLFDKVASFARSPQGRKLAAQAKDLANKPENRAKVEQVRQRLSKRGGGGTPPQP